VTAVCALPPAHTKIKSAPRLPVRRFISATKSTCVGSNTSLAPSACAFSRRSATGSIPIIFSTPIAFTTWICISPIAPNPITTTVSPGTGAPASTLCRTSANGSIIAAVENFIPAGSKNKFPDGTLTNSANMPPMPSFSKFCASAMLPADTPTPRRFKQSGKSPVLQYSHFPHGSIGSMATRSPTFTEVTPHPTASTTPAASWPSTTPPFKHNAAADFPSKL